MLVAPSPRFGLRALFHPDGALVRYGLAAVTVVLAAVCYASIDQFLEASATPFAVFTVPVMIAATYGGLGPGILATVLAALIGDYYWVEPLHSLSIVHLHEALHSGIFFGVGIAISLMSHALDTARARAVAANRAKDDFIAILSHELRNPLAPVVAAVSSIEATPGLPGGVGADLAVIRRNLATQTRLIDDLLDASRVTRGKLGVRREPACDVHRVLADAVAVCAPEARARGVTLEAADLAAAHHHAWADPARLEQVFWNLIRNAVKFTPAGGRITVATGNLAGSVARPFLQVRITDSGVGIAPDDLTRIFGLFEQGAAAQRPAAAGLGIGLALSKGIVDLHGGTIRAQSAGVGRGATFSVELPTVPAPATPPSAAPPVTAAPPPDSDLVPAPMPAPPPHDGDAHGKEILLVEDDPDTGPLLRRFLQKSGYRVTLAGDLRHALREADRRSFDLLISDLQLPDGSGADLLRQIRARHARRGQRPLRAICVSGFAGDADLRESRTAGFERHLVKPIDVEALREVIEHVPTA
jgi:signal transduction histidine kinase